MAVIGYNDWSTGCHYNVILMKQHHKKKLHSTLLQEVADYSTFTSTFVQSVNCCFNQFDLITLQILRNNSLLWCSLNCGIKANMM